MEGLVMSFEFTPDITPYLGDNQKVLIEHCTVLAISEGGCDAMRKSIVLILDTTIGKLEKV